jgi:trans-aconitate methyltransferase
VRTIAADPKARFSVVLVDRSPGMLEVSRALNPECDHVEGDMRTVRLGRQFDCVFVHDAVCYMTTEADLRAAIETAYVHCAPGGADMKTLYVTAGKTLYKVRTEIAGLPR